MGRLEAPVSRARARGPDDRVRHLRDMAWHSEGGHRVRSRPEAFPISTNSEKIQVSGTPQEGVRRLGSTFFHREGYFPDMSDWPAAADTSSEDLTLRLRRLEEQAQRDRETLQLAARKAEERLRASDLAHEDQKRQIADLAGQVSALDLAARKLEQSLEDARSDLAATEATRQELVRRVEELSLERDNLKRRVEEADQELADLSDTRAQLDDIKRVRNELREEVAGLFERIEAKDSEVRNLRARVAETEDEFREQRLRIQSDAREHARAELDERIRELEDQLVSRDAAWADIEELVRRSAEEKGQMEEQLAAKDVELDEKEAELHKRIVELEHLREQFQTSRTAEAMEALKAKGELDHTGDYTVAELRMELGEFDG